MAGNADGARKTSAKRVGVTLEEYDARLAAGEKWCGKCRAWHSASAFSIDRSRGDGLAATCRDSRTTFKPGRPTKRARRLRAAVGQSWCRDCQAWLASSEVKGGMCRTHVAAWYRANYAKNPGAIRSRVSARRRGLEPIPDWWRQEAFDKFGRLCAYGCGRAANALDHVSPVARGGKSMPSNLVPACTSCNSSKNASDPQPWIDRGWAAFPDQWTDLIALDFELAGQLEVA